MGPNDQVIKLIIEGDRLLKEDQYSEAEKRYRAALEIDPTDADAPYSLGCIYTFPENQDLEAALEWANRALEADATHYGAKMLKANALFGLEKYVNVLETLENVDPSHIEAVALIGLCHEKLGNWAEAEKIIRSVLEHDITYQTRFASVGITQRNAFFADMMYALARVLQHTGQTDEARILNRLGLLIDPACY